MTALFLDTPFFIFFWLIYYLLKKLFRYKILIFFLLKEISISLKLMDWEIKQKENFQFNLNDT